MDTLLELATATERPLLTPDEAASMLTVARGTLMVWRSSGRFNLPYVSERPAAQRRGRTGALQRNERKTDQVRVGLFRRPRHVGDQLAHAVRALVGQGRARRGDRERRRQKEQDTSLRDTDSGPHGTPHRGKISGPRRRVVAPDTVPDA